MAADNHVFELADTLLSPSQALERLGGRCALLDGRSMDPKAQIVAGFSRSIRVPGYFPPLPELRQQLRTLVELLDEPGPAQVHRRDLSLPGPAGELPARLHDCRDGANDALPVLLYLHGGGWVQGDLDTHDGLCARLAERSGAMVLALDYRLAPEHRFPAAVEDCIAAYAWLREHAASFGGDPRRVAVAGDSAGGNLCAVLSQSLTAAGRRPPEFQVLIYPATDMMLSGRSHELLIDAAIIPRDRIEWYLQQYLTSEADRLDPRASPLRADDLRGQPPTLVISAGFDPLREDASRYAQLLSDAGVDVCYHEYPGQIHAFMSLTRAIPQGLQATWEVADYVRRGFGL
ncbi:MAG: alpha/beta hydrolase [Gammaproteobacteria bacterium]|nr:alpha/beta hydrolase [Gammaproteobacteria bacterium]